MFHAADKIRRAQFVPAHLLKIDLFLEMPLNVCIRERGIEFECDYVQQRHWCSCSSAPRKLKKAMIVAEKPRL